MKNKDFIITSLQRWDVPLGSTIRNIAREIAKENRVLFINTQTENLSLSSVEEIIPGHLWVFEAGVRMLPIGRLPDGMVFDLVNKLNQHRIFSRAKKVIEKLGFKDSTLICDDDAYNSFYVNEYLKPSVSAFFHRDIVSGGGNYWSHLPRIMPLFTAKFDCVISNTQTLADSVKEYNSNYFVAGQGINPDDYNPENTSIPDDIINIPRPIVGYTGAIVKERLDADLMYAIAENLPSLSFVYVGPEDDLFKSHKLHNLSNVYFLGFKSVDTIPSYINSFDICINPQILNNITIGNYPLKIDEYLAMGKPTVATKTDAMEMFEGYVECCTGSQEYISTIERLITMGDGEDKIQRRIDFAKTHSWANCVKKMYNYIEHIKENKK